MNHFVYLYTQGVAIPASLPADASFARVFDFVSDADEAPAFRKVPYATVFLDDAAQFIPEAVVSAQTVEEWELGIPPEPNIRSGLKDRFKTRSMTVFRNWATIQPITELTRT